MAPIILGQRFKTLAEFKRSLRSWAIDSNFTPAILDSDSRRVRVGCRSSPSCPFRIRCNFNEKSGYASVTTLDDVHSCVSTSQQGTPQVIKRAETCKLKFLLEVVPELIAVDRSTPTKAIIDAVKNKYGQEIAMRQAQKVKAKLVPRGREPCRYCRLTDHVAENCPNNIAITADQQSDSDDTMGDSLEPQIPEGVQDDQQVSTEPAVRPRSTETSRLNLHSLLLTPSPPQNHRRVESGRAIVIDPDPVNGPNIAGLHLPVPGQHHVPLSHGPRTGTSNLTAASTTPSESPSEVRMEAARLMQRASNLMQEAAMLNAEAARLTASVANS